MRIQHWTRRHLRGRASALALAALLAACAGDDAPPPPCPDPVPLRDAAQLVDFRGDGRDLTDTRYEARIDNTALACQVAEDDGKRTVEAEMRILFAADKGPASESDTVRFRYFVAIADRDRNILRRREFPLALSLPGNRTRIQAVETISPTIPLRPGESGADYRIYVGFVLTPEQLDYNRRNPP